MIQEEQLSLIHIPLEIYGHFVRAILSIVINPPKDGFVNVSLTPYECSIVCPCSLAEQYFRPIFVRLGKASAGGFVSDEKYLAIQVDADGMAGSKLLVLTTPLASAGISIFFITTYFSDYIIVSQKSEARVIKALNALGFVFERHAQVFVSSNAAAMTPPVAKPVGEMLEISSISSVDYEMKLVCCGAKSQNEGQQSVILGLVETFVEQQLPKFMSVTLVPGGTPLSLLLPQNFVEERFGLETLYVGEVWIPVFLDLHEYPIHASGIVCEIAGRLSQGIKEPGIGMSYLSTIHAGLVMVGEDDIESAVDALKACADKELSMSVIDLNSNGSGEHVA